MTGLRSTFGELIPPLYDPRFEHDACGVGFVAKSSGQADHEVLALALRAVTNVTHRGAVDADQKTGDGSGILTQLPRKLFVREAARRGYNVDDGADLGVGMVFLPRQDRVALDLCTALLDHAIRDSGLILVGWRHVPIDNGALGTKAADTRPEIRQVIVARPSAMSHVDFERGLYLARKEAERRADEQGVHGFYIPSMSSRTIVYKGLMLAPQLATFYADLRDAQYETALAVFHQRYSTNVLPNWYLAQPFRVLAHNGEINTLDGNHNWLRARESQLGQIGKRAWGERASKLRPVVWDAGSDSSKLDNAVELVEQSGRDVLHTMAMMIPSAWENIDDMPASVRDFYRYHACVTEPWDGPAAIAFSDGVIAGALLDRNGLRPSRYKIDEDGLVVAASEVGVFEMEESTVVEKGRLGPGQMLAVDTANRRILHDGVLKAELASRAPYAEWAERVRPLVVQGSPPSGSIDTPALTRLQRAFGYTAEEIKFIIGDMAAKGQDPVFSMGDDTPMAVLSNVPRSVYTFLKQRFAQVTNPPIDPLRESLVMSLQTLIGSRRDLLDEGPDHARLMRLESPMLLPEQMAALRSLDEEDFLARELDATFAVLGGPVGLRRGINELCAAAAAAVADGATILVISDRKAGPGRAPIPSVLACGAVHHHLIREGVRMRADLIIESGDAWDVHHFAVLTGYGAAAIHPWLALETVGQVLDENHALALQRAKTQKQDVEALAETWRSERAERVRGAQEQFLHAAEKGLFKIMSKMGISTISSYRGAQIFEALGLAQEVIRECLDGTPSRISGLGFQEIGEDVLQRHAAAYPPASTGGTNGVHGGNGVAGKNGNGPGAVKLPNFGFIRYRPEGEYHAFNPLVVRALHQATYREDYEAYKQYSTLVHSRVPMAIRDLLTFRPGAPIPLHEVEPMESIRRRFVSTAMSLGALSPEAHRTLAVAMNRIGARSNSGEGGEDPRNYEPDANGDLGHNKIKQVASARFGVTAEYLARADELEIKMAQGSKPGEGGQLPGMKVNEIIARLRFATPGVGLISPPPHHDIYSIEDLAQLIFDLKTANPQARVGVKLVSTAGVGTIAAGVAKAYADYVLISGSDGGTGASPLSSIKNAGGPWELGLAETQQTLIKNDLRGRIVVRTDGGLKTGRDVLIAAMLGAEEYGFGTAAVVAIGCDMARRCHVNDCPAGVATQDPVYRAKFEGTAEMAVNFFTFVATEVRELLARLGFRSLDEVTGRPDLLELRRDIPAGHRAGLLDITPILTPADPTFSRPRIHVVDRNLRPSDAALEPAIIRDAQDAINTNRRTVRQYELTNAHRAVGTGLSGAIAKRHGSVGLPKGTIELRFTGSAGQSFGAWATNGIRMVLEGEANDYVGKGLCGAEIVIFSPDTARYEAHKQAIIGNTVLYGATSGRLFAAGRAGERFAVRNSGAVAVVEGAGDHCCEYMTGGTVVVLGEVGRNLGAGMSNGTAYVLDEDGTLPKRFNPEMVRLERPVTPTDLETLYSLVQEHFQATSSPRARHILDTWDAYREQFWKVVPLGLPPAGPDANEPAALEPVTPPVGDQSRA
jgi:glutamate synthase (NADPH/NADH) large chain/glutamate synthase (ferredoxin)